MSAERDLLRKIIYQYRADHSIEKLLIEAGNLLNKREDEEANALDYAKGYADGSSMLLDHFAGLAMQGIVQTADILPAFKLIAETSYDLADAMLKERFRGKL